MNCPTGTHCLSPIGAARLYGDVLFHTDSSRTPIAATPAVARQAASGEDRVEARPRPRPRRSSLGRIWKRWRGAKETGSSAQHSGLARSQGVLSHVARDLGRKELSRRTRKFPLFVLKLVPSVGRKPRHAERLPRILQAQAVRPFAGPSTGCRVEKKTHSAILTTTLRNYM